MRKLTNNQVIFIHSAIEEYLSDIMNKFGESSDMYTERKDALEPLLEELSDNDVYIGSPAAALGAKGGSAGTEAQQAARRANGAKGGRPRKVKDS